MIFFPAAQRGPWPPNFWGFYITHNDAPQSVGLRWASDQLVAETSTWQLTTLTTDKHPCPRWDSNPRSQQVVDLRLRPRGHWDRRSNMILHKICIYSCRTCSYKPHRPVWYLKENNPHNDDCWRADWEARWPVTEWGTLKYTRFQTLQYVMEYVACIDVLCNFQI